MFLIINYFPFHGIERLILSLTDLWYTTKYIIRRMTEAPVL